jgi:hypothetical protein
MPRGGFREGGGRPKGSKDKSPRRRSDRATKSAATAAPVSPKPKLSVASAPHPSLAELTPLQFWLSIMRDENADPDRRDRAAALAAPYLHRRWADDRFGTGDDRQARAQKAARGKFAAPPAPPIRG